MAAVPAPAAAPGPGPGPGAHGHVAAMTTKVGERNGVGKGAEALKGRDGDTVGREGGKEVDYDVADDDEDRWMR